ncbi:MAG: precorrin-6y C5,15-methyltransferase (decarboxylating) subunit CbiE [Rhodobacteraceae bacterium]|nr:precorrin-6y C5,15-methyltransferase (decarboxylating) subunit CbiE [Paracoccaceae bacterium]
MTEAWLKIIGVSEDGHLSATARDALSQAKTIFGSQRLLDLIAADASGQSVLAKAELLTWPSPFSSVYPMLEALRGTSTAILASGDPQWFGIGASLTKRFATTEIESFPAVSSFQLAAARMGWSLQDVETFSIHGRPIETLRCVLYPGARIIALTSNGVAPHKVASLLRDADLGRAKISVLEAMGSANESRIDGSAETWTASVADFHVLAIEIPRDARLSHAPRSSGLPDEAFEHDGKMTKAEVRAITLASLQPYPGALLWDIGSGCGSVAIEWMRAARNAKAIGLEPHQDRRQMSVQNANALGVPDLTVMDAKAPEALDGLPTPDAIFIGGGLTTPHLLETCHDALKPGGRLVANAVTLESEAVLLDAFQRLGGDLTRIAIHRADPVGHLTGWRPSMPVTHWVLVKAAGHAKHEDPAK